MAGNDLRLQVILQTIDKASGVLRKVEGTSKEAARALKDTRDKLRELTAQQKAVGEFRELRTGLRDTTERLQAAQQRVTDLARAISQAGVPTKAMVRDFADAKKSAAALGEEHQRQGMRVQTLRDKLTAAGISAGQLGTHERQLRADILATKGAIESQTNALKAQAAEERRLAALKEKHAKAMLHTGMAVGAGYAMKATGTAAVRGIMSPVGSYMAHQDAMLGVAKQVNGARVDGKLTQTYRDVEAEVRKLSTEIPLTTTKIAEMVTAAARMEVPREELSKFTRTAAMMATAFEAVPEVLTESMGKVAKNFKIPITEIEGLADSINYLDDNAISKGADIIDFLNRTSGVISMVAMSAKDAAALGSTLLTLGERPETASTAANAIVQKFAAATKGTKKFKEAMKEIGLSTADVQKGMATDATGTIKKVISAIGALPKEKRLGVMVELVGLEHSDTLAKLVDKPEELERQQKLANGSEAKGSMQREFSARMDTMSANMQTTKNRAFNLAAVVGERLEPALSRIAAVVNPVLEALTTWVQANPNLVSGIMTVALGLAALVAAAGFLLIPLALVAGKMALTSFIASKLGLALPTLSGVLRGVGSVLGLVGRAVMGLWGAFVAGGPIVWAITAIIVAVAAAAYLIYRNWGPISTFFVNMWNTVKLAFTDAIEWIANLPGRFYSFGAQMIQGLVNGITGTLGTVREAIVGAADSAVGWFKEKLGIHSPSRVFMMAGEEVGNGAAEGIANRHALVRKAAAGIAAATLAAGMLGGALAGQDNPLRVDNTPPLTAAAAGGGGAAAQGGGDTISITINGAGMDAQAIAKAVSAELDRRQRARGATTRSALSDIN